jgi:lipoyl-dependent peroxiredoxin
MKLALPRQLGGKGDATNPETLFAGGYAACFENALLHISRDAIRGNVDVRLTVSAH